MDINVQIFAKSEAVCTLIARALGITEQAARDRMANGYTTLNGNVCSGRPDRPAFAGDNIYISGSDGTALIHVVR